MSGKQRKSLGQFYLLKATAVAPARAVFVPDTGVGEDLAGASLCRDLFANPQTLTGASSATTVTAASLISAIPSSSPHSTPYSSSHSSPLADAVTDASSFVAEPLYVLVTCYLHNVGTGGRSRRIKNNNAITFKVRRDGSLEALCSPLYSLTEVGNMAEKYSDKLFAMLSKQQRRINIGPFSEAELQEQRTRCKLLVEAFLARRSDLAPLAAQVVEYTYKFHVSRWGACYRSGRINFNPALAALPREIAEYVMVHEFCHLKELNHGKKFWEYVESFCPDYALYRRELKNYNLLKAD